MERLTSSGSDSEELSSSMLISLVGSLPLPLAKDSWLEKVALSPMMERFDVVEWKMVGRGEREERGKVIKRRSASKVSEPKQ